MVINCSTEIAKFLASNPARNSTVIWGLATPGGLFRWPKVPDDAQKKEAA